MAAVKELVKVSRRLPLEPVALRVALLFLALDTITGSRRWTLGDLGALELHTEFESLPAKAGSDKHCSSTHGHLSAPGGFTVDTEIVLTTREGADPRLTLRADAGCVTRRDELEVAARAGLDELAEELLFFGTRQQTVS